MSPSSRTEQLIRLTPLTRKIATHQNFGSGGGNRIIMSEKNQKHPFEQETQKILELLSKQREHRRQPSNQLELEIAELEREMNEEAEQRRIEEEARVAEEKRIHNLPENVEARRIKREADTAELLGDATQNSDEEDWEDIKNCALRGMEYGYDGYDVQKEFEVCLKLAIAMIHKLKRENSQLEQNLFYACEYNDIRM